MAQADEGKRPGYLNQLWPEVAQSSVQLIRIGGNGYEHHFPDRTGLNAMIDSIRGTGAEPLLQVPSNFTEIEAVDLVKDFKYSKDKGVRFYSIGNEPICNNKGEIDAVYEYIKRIAPAMKAVASTIKIFVFDGCTLDEDAYAALCGGRLDITGKDKNGHWMIDGFTFHNYPNGRDFDRNDVVFSGPYHIKNQVQQLIQMMEKADSMQGRTGKNKLVWGLTETNVTYPNPIGEISGIGNPALLGGQFIAEIYGLGMKYGAFTVDPWCISETDRMGTDFGYLGLPSEFYPRSGYYHTQMMTLHMNGDYLPSSTSNSFVKSIASIGDNQLVVMILNESKDKDFNFDLVLNQNGRLPKPLVVNANAGLDITISGMIPRQTTRMYILSKTGKIKTEYTYEITHNLRHLPPDVNNM